MSIRLQAARPGKASRMLVIKGTLVIGVIALIFIAVAVATAEHPECQHTTEFGEISIAGPITNVPEFHDCQRLITDGEYGPVVAVWVSYRINQLYTDMWPVELSPLPNPDSILADSTFAGAIAETGTTARSVPVVQIYNYGDPVAFAPFGELPSGFTCVYFTAVRGPILTAWTNSTGTTDDCIGARSTPIPSPPLFPVTQVSFGTTHPFEETDYPPVARWEMDSAQSHVLGVKCGRAWCRLGSGAPVLDHGALAPAPGKAARVFSIPGWYDEQVLSAPGGLNWVPFRFVKGGPFFGRRPVWIPRKLVPSGVRGAIFPDTALADNEIDDYFENWVRAAEVHLSEPSEHYAKKFNFVHHTEQPAAVIYLRHNTKHVPWPLEPEEPGDVTVDYDWEAAIVSSAGDTIFRKVIWRGYHNSETHPGWVPTPGTVRWRWLEVDETTWEWCPEGCCETTTEELVA